MQTEAETPLDTASRKPNRSPRKATHRQQLLTIPQGTDLYGIPERSLMDLIARGLLPAVQFPGGRRLWIVRQDLEQLIQRSKEVRA